MSNFMAGVFAVILALWIISMLTETKIYCGGHECQTMIADTIIHKTVNFDTSENVYAVFIDSTYRCDTLRLGNMYIDMLGVEKIVVRDTIYLDTTQARGK